MAVNVEDAGDQSQCDGHRPGTQEDEDEGGGGNDWERRDHVKEVTCFSRDGRKMVEDGEGGRQGKQRHLGQEAPLLFHHGRSTRTAVGNALAAGALIPTRNEPRLPVAAVFIGAVLFGVIRDLRRAQLVAFEGAGKSLAAAPQSSRLS